MYDVKFYKFLSSQICINNKSFVLQMKNDFLIPIISVIAFQSILIIYKNNHYIALIGFNLLFDSHKVTIVNTFLNHRLTA